MRGLFSKMLSIPDGPRSAGAVIKWWEIRRIGYSALTFVFLLLLTLVMSGIGRLSESVDFSITYPLMLLMWCNVGYTAGWVVELIIRKIATTDSTDLRRFGPWAFVSGSLATSLIIASLILILVAVERFNLGSTEAKYRNSVAPPDRVELAGWYTLTDFSMHQIEGEKTVIPADSCGLRLRPDGTFDIYGHILPRLDRRGVRSEFMNGAGRWELRADTIGYPKARVRWEVVLTSKGPVDRIDGRTSNWMGLPAKLIVRNDQPPHALLLVTSHDYYHVFREAGSDRAAQ